MLCDGTAYDQSINQYFLVRSVSLANLSTNFDLKVEFFEALPDLEKQEEGTTLVLLQFFYSWLSSLHSKMQRTGSE
jgi:hypothetical protein